MAGSAWTGDCSGFEKDDPFCYEYSGDRGVFVFGLEGIQLAGQSIECTGTVEVFFFDSPGSRDEMCSALADTAEGPGSVYFAEGRNWFVVDFSEVARGVDSSGDVAGPTPASQDLSVPAEELKARYTVEE